jgi:hypothetical protein
VATESHGLFFVGTFAGGAAMSAKIQQNERLQKSKEFRKPKENEVFGPYCVWL